MSELARKNCIPCKGGVPPLTLAQKQQLLLQLGPDWQLVSENKKLLRKVATKDFQQALDLVNQIGPLAQQQWHHPDLSFGFGYLDILLWTHKINDLVESDFILAAKIEQILKVLEYPTQD